MPMLAGSPCYPPWRFLTSLWRDYTDTWRSFSSPLTVPPIAMSGPEPVAMYELGEVAVAAYATAGNPLGGWLALIASDPVTPALESSSAAQIDAAAAASSVQIGADASGSANVSNGASATNDSVLVVDGGAGGLLRTVSLPPARLSTGRLTWRS